MLQTTTTGNDDDRRQRPLLVWPPTLCRVTRYAYTLGANPASGKGVCEGFGEAPVVSGPGEQSLPEAGDVVQIILR